MLYPILKSDWHERLQLILSSHNNAMRGIQWCIDHSPSEITIASGPLAPICCEALEIDDLVTIGNKYGLTSVDDMKIVKDLYSAVEKVVDDNIDKIVACFNTGCYVSFDKYQKYVRSIFVDYYGKYIDEIYDCFVGRDIIEAFFRAGNLLHQRFVVSDDDRRVISESDAILREAATHIFTSTDMIVTLSDSDRWRKEFIHPTSSWWWWLDTK